MTGLLFYTSELLCETQALRAMAKDFLESDGTRVLTALERDLKRICASNRDRAQKLTLCPLRTKSTCSYEAGNKFGGQEIYALIRGTWDLLSLGQTATKRKIRFVGNASTVIELWPRACAWKEKFERDSRLAMWRVELGAQDSPGCYFHIQILGDRVPSPYPKGVPIPRFPSPFITPMAALEFVLGELFQDEWPIKARQSRHEQKSWRAIQRKRWSNLLAWQKEVITQSTSTESDAGLVLPSSPWIDLKLVKPPSELFC